MENSELLTIKEMAQRLKVLSRGFIAVQESRTVTSRLREKVTPCNLEVINRDRLRAIHRLIA